MTFFFVCTFTSIFDHFDTKIKKIQQKRKRSRKEVSKLGVFISDLKPLTCTHAPYSTIQIYKYMYMIECVFIYWFTDFLNVALFCGRRRRRGRSLQFFLYTHISSNDMANVLSSNSDFEGVRRLFVLRRCGCCCCCCCCSFLSVLDIHTNK